MTAAVLAAATVRLGDAVLDLGCGTGEISLPLAARGADVLGIDVSPAMADLLRAKAGGRRLKSVTAAAVPMEKLVLRPRTFDLIVSSYALHHRRDPDKALLVRACYHWLRPGGRLVIADMMLGRGGSARDREIIRAKLGMLARRGRVAGGASSRTPCATWCASRNARSPGPAWARLCDNAGLAPVATFAIVAESGLVTARRPDATARQVAERRSAPQVARR